MRARSVLASLLFAAGCFAQILPPPGAAVRMKNLPGSCVSGTSPAVIFNTGGVDGVYTCDNTGHYALAPGGSTTVLAGATQGPGGSNTLNSAQTDVVGVTSGGLPLPYSYVQGGTGAVGRTQTSKNKDRISAMDFGPDPTGVLDSSAAIQAAVNAATTNNKCLYVPAGKYKLATPVTFTGGVCVEGENGTDVAASSVGKATVFYPTTAGFVTALPLTVMDIATFKNLQFNGGSYGLDLGQVGSTNLDSISCVDTTGYCVSHVNGEHHYWRQIYCWHHAVGGAGCLSFGDPTNSTLASVFAGGGVTDGIFDRGIIDDIRDLSDSTSISDNYTMWSNAGSVAPHTLAFGSTAVRKVIVHNSGLIIPFRFYAVQNSHFSDLVTDGVGTVGTPATSMFETEDRFQLSSINGFFPAFSANSFFTNGLYIKSGWIQSSIKNCSMGGNNTTTFGIRVGTFLGVTGTIESCTGSFFDDVAGNPLFENRIQVIGSTLSPTNQSGTTMFSDPNNTGATVMFMGDGNGSAAGTGHLKIIRATGVGGNNTTDLDSSATGATWKIPLIEALGVKYQCTHGTNGTCGVVTLASGTATVSTTAIAALAAAGAAGDSVNLVLQSCSSCGALSVGTVTAATSFVINSTNASDASNVYWEIRHIN